MLFPIQLFKLLADETRLSIVLLLRETGELCVCDICTVLSESQPKISRHIALLRDAELLLDRREGKWIYYRLSPHIPAWAANIIEASWNCQQAAIKAQVNKLVDSNCTPDGKALCC
ncbi:transcriptional regulator [Xenorhabdus kozodoii]|uniref:Arsenical resistance operon repressor n=1 Tax=Xenorhabdus kozodoii TaxID=351676 RepID=A0A2D0LDU9_9GAMM|nr:transcriptional regulator [Xenorhabdus kozodoii]